MKNLTRNLIFVLASVLIFVACEDEEPIVKVNTNFNGLKTSVMVEEDVHFADLSIGEPIEWLWEFEGGTPETSVLQNPVVSYLTPGVYSVKLTSSNSDDTDFEEKIDFITVYSEVNSLFTVSKEIVDQSETVTFTDNSEGEPTAWLWTFEGGTPATSTEQNPIVVFENAGEFVVTLEVDNQVSSSSSDKEIVCMPTSNLQAFYPFNGNANDESGNEHHGTLFGDIQTTTDRNGVENSAYAFDGVNDYVNTFTSFDYQDRTVSAWIKHSDLYPQVSQIALVQDDGDLSHGLFGIISRYDGVHILAGGITGRYILKPYEVDEWMHIVMIRNATETKYYIDNELVLTSTSDNGGSTSSPNSILVVGCGRSMNMNFFNGEIDDVRVYNRELTSSEVNLLYKY